MQLFVFEGLNCMDKQTFTIYYSVFKNLTLSVWNAHCTLMFMPANICTNVHTNVQCTLYICSKKQTLFAIVFYKQILVHCIYSTVHFAHSNQSLYIAQYMYCTVHTVQENPCTVIQTVLYTVQFILCKFLSSISQSI